MRPEAGAHLWDAAEAARLVYEFTRGRTMVEFNTDLIIRSAVERQLEILGEALNRLRREDVDTGARVPDLDKIVGMRNIIAHEYGDIDYEIVWRAATTSIPELLPVLDELVAEARRTAGI
ncbi:HepT-like ribonuclease domain-containing protein [Microbacterium sp.]|uniref:HepT-like ribonuclease domain-containing protein n=1 Tax=Microbacterium sp. TaxID=51671 RepID=UPI0026375A57|nr:HepT-like ribonuclease domain-containing protein [Microbacterium sp.]